MRGFAAAGAFAQLRAKYQRASAKLATAAEKSEEVLGVVLNAAEVGGTCFALSAANACYGKPDPKRPGVLRLQVVQGVDVDMTGALAGHVVAFFMKKHGEHAHAIANGALCSWLARLGTEFGGDQLVKRNQTKGLSAITGLQAMTGMGQITGGGLHSVAGQYVQRYNSAGVPVR